jgi:hypothetical protein
MAKLGISTGTTPNDGLGDNLLAGAVKINSNFSEIYNRFGDGTNLTAIGGTWTSTSAGIHTLKNVGIGTTNPRFTLEVGAVGASGTTLFVNGDARVTGIVTIGPASITLNGISNIINVGTGITINGSTGIISATAIVLGGTTLTGAAVTFITAGSGISVNSSTGNVTITATGGSGIVIKDSGSLVGTAGTIDFGDNLSVSAISAGVVTVTGSAGGGSSQWVTAGVGIHTLSNVGIGTTNPTSALTVKGNTSLETLSVSGVSTLTSNVSVGGTISVDGAVKLITNNGTIVGTSGSTGEIKRIAGAPFFYDGSAWREFVLSTGTPVAVPADTEWDNVILRSTYDTDSPDFFDFKFSEQPILTGTGATTVASPVKIGTRSFRNNGAVGAGISYAYRAEHDFTGPWTIEFWINHDGLPYNSSAYAESMVSQISLSDSGNNLSFGVQYGGTDVDWYWFNEANADEKQLHSVTAATFNSNFVSQWKHYALVRESSNGSLHFYIDGYEVGITTNNSVIDTNITSTNGAGLHIGGIFSDTINNEGVNSASSIDAHFDDLRITTDQRYVSVGNTTTQVFVPSITALPTTGTLSSYVQPPGDKYGEIGLGTSPTWRGTSGVTVSQQSSGNYRVSFASTYTNSNDYFVLSHAMDQGFASYVGIARSTTHVDFAINQESDNAVVNTGSLSVQIKNHL